MQIEKKQKRSKKQSKAGKLLDLYIRNNKKQALLVHTQQTANLEHISHLIHTRFNVPQTDQLLFYNGQRIQSNQQSLTLDVQDKAIIHLVDQRNITDNLIINVRRLNVKRVEQFRVPASQVIQDFIVRNIQQQESNRLFFVYTGRQLNPRNSFADQFVENQSQLFCLDQVKDELVGERRQKYAQRSKRQQRKQKVSSQKQKQGQEFLKQQSSNAPQKQTENVKIESIDEQTQKRQKQQQYKMPNFKKKNVSQQVNLGNDIPINIHQPNQQSSTSLINDQPLQETKSNLVPNPFFNEGSSISSIFLQQNQNPQSGKRLDEASGMFNSVYMGLNNDSMINQQVRGSSLISEQEIKQENSGSFNFDNRAPELYAPQRNALATYNQDEMIIQQSKQDYTQSKDLSVRDIEEQRISKNSKDLSGYQLQSIQNHQLSASAELQDQIFQNKQSPRKSKGNEILIEEFQREQNRTLQYQGSKIQPIPFYRHEQQIQVQRQQREQGNKMNNQWGFGTPQIVETQHPTCQVDVYLIEQDNLANPTQSQLIEAKEQRQTNRYSNSNFYSSNSSRAKQYDINNEYNFGQFQKVNKNRLSGFKEDTPKYNDPQLEHSLSQHHQHQVFKQQNQQIQNQRQHRQRKQSEDHSLNIVELPVQARIKENSSLLLDQDSKFGANVPYGSCKPFSQQRQWVNKVDFDGQNSGIDELNKLISIAPERTIQITQQQAQKLSEQDRNLFYKQFDLLAKQRHQQAKPTLIQTSLNLRMVKSSSKNQQIVDSPIVAFNSDIKGLLDSYQSFQKIIVKNSSSNINSYTPSLSNQLRFTSGRQTFNIGDFVLNCDRNLFNPLSYFIDVLDRQESYQLLKSYP